MEDTRVLRGELVSAIRRWRPEVVVTHDPEHSDPAYLCHRDRRVTSQVILDAVYALARELLTFPEHAQAGLALYAVSEAWFFASATPTTVVDITAGFGGRSRHVWRIAAKYRTQTRLGKAGADARWRPAHQ